MIYGASDALIELLNRQGMSVGSVGAGDTQGMDAGMLEGTAHPLTAQTVERREPMGMKKAGSARLNALRQVSRHEGDMHGGGIGTGISKGRVVCERPLLILVKGGRK